MAASEVIVSARTGRAYGKKGDCEQSINVIDCNKLFYLVEGD